MRRACLLLAVSCLSACPQSGAPVEGPFPQVVGPAGGVLFNEAGVRLEIPAGALEQDTTIDAFFIGDEATLSPEASFVGPAVEFSPRGITFRKPVTLTMPTSATKLADYAKTPAECLMWLRKDDGTWSQAPALSNTDDSVTVEANALVEAAVGAKFSFVLPSTHPLVKDCVEPDGFCVTALPEALKGGNANWSSIVGGRLWYRTDTTDGGLVVIEYDVVNGVNSRSSGVVALPKPPSTPPAGAVLARTARIAIAPDGGAWVPLPGQGLARVAFSGDSKVFPDDKTGGTVGVVITPDATLHRAQLLSSNTSGSSLQLRSGLAESPAATLEKDAKAVPFDSVPLLPVGSGVGYLFRTATTTRAIELRADGGVPMVLHPRLAQPLDKGNTIDELAVSPDGTITAASLLASVAEGSLFIQSRSGATSVAVKLPNLNALEFGEAGALYAASATSPHVYRVDLSTGAVETVVLTTSTDPNTVQSFIPVALRRLFVPATSTQKELNGLYVVVGTPAARRVLLVKRAARVEDCTTLPCQNGGTCIDAASGPACLCPVGTTGPQCATDVDECSAARPGCATGETCTNTQNSFTCACPTATTSAPFCAPAPARRISLLAFYDLGFARRELAPEKAIVQEVNDTKAILEGALVNGAGFTLGLAAIVDGSRAVPASVLDPSGDGPTRLTRFSTWVSANRAALTAMVGHPWDHAVLFSGAELSPTTLELSFQSAMCTSNSATIVTRTPSTLTDSTRAGRANVFAHTLGHVLGAAHDTQSGFVMSATYDPRATAPLSFSAASLAAMAAFLGTTTAVWPGCLDDTPASTWAAPHCGDGVVQEPEQCDPGVATVDACCAGCRLVPGCRCANSDPCCQAGALVSDGGLARAARNECDLAESCDGTTAAPLDWVKLPGAACGDGGVCLRGDCVPSFAGYCGARFQSNACAPTPFDCSRSYCTATSSAVCTTPGSVFFDVPTADGISCGAASQCSAGACVASMSLVRYQWATADFGACVLGVATRAVTCRDDRGQVVADGLCPAGLRPRTARTCP